MVVPYGIYIEDYSNLEEEAWEIAHIDLIDEDLLQKDRTKALVHIYISPEESPAEAVAFLRERYTAEGIENEITLDPCVEEDWINNWKQYFKPIPVGEKLLIRPTWEEVQDSGGRIVLDLDPGLAFGTGTHETTRLCMELLEKYVQLIPPTIPITAKISILRLVHSITSIFSSRMPIFIISAIRAG